MRFTDNASIATDTMVNDDILAGTDVSTGNDRKFTLANLAAWLLNKFTGLSLAGSNQTVKSALDSLNSNTVNTTFASSDTSKYTLNNVRLVRRGSVYLLLGEVKCISPETSNEINIVSGNMVPVSIGQTFAPAWGTNNASKDALGVHFDGNGVYLSYGTAGGYYELSIPMFV